MWLLSLDQLLAIRGRPVPGHMLHAVFSGAVYLQVLAPSVLVRLHLGRIPLFLRFLDTATQVQLFYVG